MRRFRERLKDALAQQQWSQVELSRRCDANPANVSRWLSGTAMPDRRILGKLLSVFPDKLAADLLAAWLSDSMPEDGSRLVSVLPRQAPLLQEETPEQWPEGISKDTKNKFLNFSRLAMTHPDVMKIVDVLHDAAMRMAYQSKDR